MFVFFLLILIFSALYEPLLIRKMLGLRKRIWPLQLLGVLFLIGYFAVIASRVFVRPNVVWAAVYDFLGLYFIFQVYLFLYLRLVQILGLIGRLAARRGGSSSPAKPGKLLKAAAAIGLALCAGLVLYGTVKARFFCVTEFEIALPRLEKAVTVVHLPDLHLGDSRGKAYLESVLEKVREIGPDIVLYNGDLVDSRMALRDEVFDLFRGLAAEQYFTTGNHEYYVGADEVIAMVRKAGIRVLRSESVETHGIQLIGLEYMNADRQSRDAHQVNQLIMEEELPKIPKSGHLPAVVVHHSPVGVKYVEAYGAEAMLSGHTHGGQLFPGTVIIKSRFPMFRGLYPGGQTSVLVSQGAGTFGPMMRLGTFNEVQVVRFVPAANSGQ
ncbi:MAG: metallophosphoesterase [Deltaproteobacteria bacterium]|nr:metallophosphoesterase [Deltaproteobacteria bacterium]